MSLLDEMLSNAGVQIPDNSEEDITGISQEDSGINSELPYLPEVPSFGNYSAFGEEPKQNVAQLPDGAQLYEMNSQPTIADAKALSVEDKESQKLDSVAKKDYWIKTNIGIMDDSDSGFFSDGREYRAKGFDAYEVNHPGQLEDQTIQQNGRTVAENTRARIDRQKERYARQFGVPVDEVTDQMIYNEGARDSFKAYEALTRKPGDQRTDWDNVPMNIFPGVEPNKDFEFNIGSKATPLDIAIWQQRNKDGSVATDRYGREISEIVNPYTGEKLSDAMKNPYNVMIFNENGKFDEEAVEDESARLAGWKGTKPSEMTDYDEIMKYNEWKDDKRDLWGEDWFDMIQASLTNQLAKVSRAIDENGATEDAARYRGEDAVSNALIVSLKRKIAKTKNPEHKAALEKRLQRMMQTYENASKEHGIDDATIRQRLARKGIKNPTKDQMKLEAAYLMRKKALDSSLINSKDNFLGLGIGTVEAAENEGNVLDQKFGVSRGSRKKALEMQKSGEEAFKNGDYTTWFTTRVAQLPSLTADSAGELTQLMLPGGVLHTAFTRLNEREHEFEKKNGRPMTQEEKSETLLLEGAALGVDKVLTKLGLGKLEDIVRAKGGISKPAGIVGITALGEVPQEYSENVVEGYETRKKQNGDTGTLFSSKQAWADLKTEAKKPENIERGLTGGISAGGLASGSLATATAARVSKDAAKVPIKTARKIKKKMLENKYEQAGSMLTVDDVELASAVNDMTVQQAEDVATTAQEVVDVLESANSIDDIVNSDNEVAQASARAIVDDNFKPEKPGDAKHRQAVKYIVKDIIDGKVDDDNKQVILDSLGVTEEDIANMSEEEINEVVDTAFEENGDTINAVVPTDVATTINYNNVDEETSKAILNAYKAKAQMSHSIAKASVESIKKANEPFERGSKNARDTSSEIKDDVNIDELSTGVKTKDNMSKAEVIKDILKFWKGNKTNKKIDERLNKYSDESLNAFVNSEPTEGVDAKTYKSLQSRAKNILSKRKNAKKLVGIDSTPINIEAEASKVTDKASLVDFIGRAVKSRKIKTTKERDLLLEKIDDALNKDLINEKQASILKKRVENISSDIQEEANTKKSENKQENKKENKKDEINETEVDRRATEIDSIKEKAKKALEMLNESSLGQKATKLLEKQKNEELTKEEQSIVDEYVAQKNKLQDEAIKAIKDVGEKGEYFFPSEQELNERYSSLEDEIFKDADIITEPEEAFTEDEKEALGLC